MIRVVIIDDHTLFRQAIAGQIRSVGGFEIAGESGSGTGSVQLIEKLQPDIAVIDISLPGLNGIEVVKRIRKKGIDCEVVLLSMYRYPELMETLKSLKINAYVLKNDAFDDLIYALRAVSAGKQYLSPSLLVEATVNDTYLLSRREKEILCFIADGLSSREIAEELSLSIKTVETHRVNIMKKMGAKNVADMIKQAIKKGVIT